MSSIALREKEDLCHSIEMENFIVSFALAFAVIQTVNGMYYAILITNSSLSLVYHIKFHNSLEILTYLTWSIRSLLIFNFYLKFFTFFTPEKSFRCLVSNNMITKSPTN